MSGKRSTRLFVRHYVATLLRQREAPDLADFLYDGLPIDQHEEAKRELLRIAGRIERGGAAALASPAPAATVPSGFTWTDAMYDAFNPLQGQKSHPHFAQLLAVWRALHGAAEYTTESDHG